MMQPESGFQRHTPPPPYERRLHLGRDAGGAVT